MESENRLQLENLICNIIFLRKHFGISKRKMAKLLGIGVGSLQKLEQGILPPRLGVDIFFHIRRNFGIAPVTILTHRLEEFFESSGEHSLSDNKKGRRFD